MSAASDRIQELVYPTKPRLYVGLGDPPDERVTAEDLKTVFAERADLLAALERVSCSPVMDNRLHDGSDQTIGDVVRAAIAKARGGK